MTAAPDAHVRQIAVLNDLLRQFGLGGKLFLTSGVVDRGQDFIGAALRAVAGFDTFDEDNDPHGEHDFGVVEVAGEPLFFKIDYYDLELRFASPDAADPAVTRRVLTIMLEREY